MKAIVIIHDPSEGLGTLEDYFAFKRVTVSTVCLYANEALPETVDGYDAVVSMGGPMNVYEDETYPFLREEAAFLKQAIDRDVPVLGICLGAQMIARACGASVHKGLAKELGWDEVLLTDAGSEDRVFNGLPEALTVFQWHEDSFELPVGATLLATSAACPHQAFRYRNAYGLQFHVEVTPHMLSEWFASSPEKEGIIRQLDAMEPEYIRQALRLYSNFVEIMKSKALSSFHLQSTPAAL
jgi:GMP synthase-like glutamine amidotransferase